MQRYRLRYAGIDELDSSAMAFDEIAVESAEGITLGGVNGFLLDRVLGRPFYVVVDGGGWFKSRYFLVPIGHARLDTERHALVTDLPHERVSGFPGFDLDEFETLSDEVLNRIDEHILAACCPDELIDRAASGARYDQWAHYRQPDWWQSSYYRRDPSEVSASSATQSRG